eukprot:CAMPEP_0114536682 /NCGR_PEP_ID=MMETSP0109-20121206/29149_1 /TAXON_ID=29199 /ORGANISM="Chlorarachnion reptans, Strain CCCM449" /LENGTH=193 /DNA_ID=CAMNT_0001720469 /DNA_START=163 /DNA_END=741 /DNA_ORIENTATION=+
MLALMRDEEGEVASVQATYLRTDTFNKDPDLSVPKRTYGSLKGSMVTISEPPRPRLDNITMSVRGNYTRSYVAEGIETALSIAEVMPSPEHIVATLGKHNIRHLNPDRLAKTVILCLDNDGPATYEDGSIAQTVVGLIQRGKEVFIIMPEGEKTDFNDVLRFQPKSEQVIVQQPFSYGRNILEKQLKNSIKEW